MTELSAYIIQHIFCFLNSNYIVRSDNIFHILSNRKCISVGFSDNFSSSAPFLQPRQQKSRCDSLSQEAEGE